MTGPTKPSERGPEPDETEGGGVKEGSFLARWSRRKRGRTALPAAADPPPEERAAPVADAPEVPPAPLVDADMPPLDSLDGDSDYSPFLSEGVSEALRRRALRKLFHSAKFNVVDGLDDYAEDFRSFIPLGDVVTAEMRHRTQAQARRAQPDVEAPAQPPDAPLAPEPAAEAAATQPAPAAGGPAGDEAGEEVPAASGVVAGAPTPPDPGPGDATPTPDDEAAPERG